MATDNLGRRTARPYSSYHTNRHSEVINQEQENLRHLDKVVFVPIVNGISKQTQQIHLDKKNLLKSIEKKEKSLLQLIVKHFQSLKEKVVANCSKNADTLAEKRRKITEVQSKMKEFCRNQRKMSISSPSEFDMPHFLREVEKFKRRGRNIAHDEAVVTIESIELAEVSGKGEELLQRVGSAIASVKIEELFDVGVVEKHYRVRINTPPMSQISKRNSGKHGKNSSLFPALASQTVTQPGQLQIIPIQSKQLPEYSSSHAHSLKNERNKKHTRLQSSSSLAGDERELPKFAQSTGVIPSTDPTPHPPPSHMRASSLPMSTSGDFLQSSVATVHAHPAKVDSVNQLAQYKPSPPSSLRSSCQPEDGRLRTRTSSVIMSVRSVSPDECDRPDDGPRTRESRQSVGHLLPLVSSESSVDTVHAHPAKVDSVNQLAQYKPSPPSSLRSSYQPKDGRLRTRTSSVIMSVRSVSPDECDRLDDGPRTRESRQSVGHPLPLVSSESTVEKAFPTHCTGSSRPYAHVSPFLGGMVKSLHHPYGVDTLTDGTRVVVETDTLHFLDKESDKVFKSIDLYAKDEAKATGCFDLTVLPNDDVIISDSQQRALLIVRNHHEGSDIFMPLNDVVPKGVANDGQLIYVSDAEGRCVHKIDIATKSIIGRIDLSPTMPTGGIGGSTRSREVRRPCPKYLAINGQGDIVVSDAYNSTLYLINTRDNKVRVSMFGSETIPQLARPKMPAGVSWLSDHMFVVAVQGTEQTQLLVIDVGASHDGREPTCDVVNVFGAVRAEDEDEQVMGSPEGVTTHGYRVLVSDFARLHSFPLGYVTDGASV